jgi:hypothetical protein
LGSDARVSEEEAFVVVVGYEDGDGGVDAAGGEEEFWVVGDEDVVGLLGTGGH